MSLTGRNDVFRFVSLFVYVFLMVGFTFVRQRLKKFFLHSEIY